MRVNYNPWKASNALRGWANRRADRRLAASPRTPRRRRPLRLCEALRSAAAGVADAPPAPREGAPHRPRLCGCDARGRPPAACARGARTWRGAAPRTPPPCAAGVWCGGRRRRGAGAWRREYRINTDADAHWRRGSAARRRWWRHAAADDASQRARADWSRCRPRASAGGVAEAAARGWRRAAAATLPSPIARRRLGPAVGAWVMWSDRAAWRPPARGDRHDARAAFARALGGGGARDAGRRVTAELHAAAVWKRRRMARLVHAWHAAAAARAADQRAVAAMGAQRARRERDAWWALWRRRLAQRRWAQAAAERRAVACGRLHVEAWRARAPASGAARALVQRHLLGDVAAASARGGARRRRARPRGRSSSRGSRRRRSRAGVRCARRRAWAGRRTRGWRRRRCG